MKNTMKILSRVVLIGFICVLFSLCNSKEVKAAVINYNRIEGGSFYGPGEANDNEVVTFAFTPPDAYYVSNADVEDLVRGGIACEIISGDSDRKSTVMFRFTVPANGTTINVSVSCSQRTNRPLVFFVNGSGATSPAEGSHQYLAYEDVAITATPDPGNIFVNWTTTQNHGTFADASSASTTYTMSDQAETIWANFATAPTITFDANGGSVSPTYAQVGTNRKLASLPTPTWTGHNCIGWFTQATGGVEVTENTEFTSNTTIYAHWENATAAPTITTTSLPNGTVGEAYSQSLQASGGSGALSWEITSGTPPHFSLSSSGVLSGTPDSVGQYPFTVKVTDALDRSDTKDLTITIYSAAATHTVTFDPNGNGATVSPATRTTKPDGTIETYPTPQWTGHTFAGWYTAASGGTPVPTDRVYNANTRIYAHWTETPPPTTNHTVTYKVVHGKWNDGSTGDKTETVADNGHLASIPAVGNEPDANYKAGSWSPSTPNTSTAITSDKEYTYTYVPESATTYTVTTSDDGHGSAEASPTSGITGTRVTITAIPDRDYQFKEWRVIRGGVDLDNRRRSQTTFNIGNANVEVKAIFEKKDRKKDDDDDDDDHEDSSSPAPAKPINPNAIINSSFTMTGGMSGIVKIGPQVQGSAAQAVFKANTPAGWKEAFSFNMTVNDKADYTLKKGILSFKIPSQYLKAGRKFAILGIDKNGKVKMFPDIDTKDDTITMNIDIEGYAFDLIYFD